MSAYQVTDTLLERMRKRNDDFYLLNLANPDMVGHSGKLLQTARAVEVTDPVSTSSSKKCWPKVVEVC
jgi:2,3-bisphosphoglycerate-independent phosphoglycerate mutase